MTVEYIRSFTRNIFGFRIHHTMGRWICAVFFSLHFSDVAFGTLWCDRHKMYICPSVYFCVCVLHHTNLYIYLYISSMYRHMSIMAKRTEQKITRLLRFTTTRYFSFLFSFFGLCVFFFVRRSSADFTWWHNIWLDRGNISPELNLLQFL